MLKKSRVAKNILALVFWLAVWETVALIVDKEILLPTPFTVISCLFGHMTSPEYYYSVAASFARIALGSVIGTFLGCIMAYSAFASDIFEAIVSPLISIIKSTPVASFIILALVWMGKSAVPVFTSVLMVIPVVYSGVLNGLNSTDIGLHEVALAYSFGFFKKLRLLYIPSSLSSFASSAVTSFGLAWKAGIAAEVLCSLKNSIGGNIYTSKLYLETPDLMAWTLTVIVLSILFEWAISKAFAPLIKRFAAADIGGMSK